MDGVYEKGLVARLFFFGDQAALAILAVGLYNPNIPSAKKVLFAGGRYSGYKTTLVLDNSSTKSSRPHAENVGKSEVPPGGPILGPFMPGDGSSG
jgi:hypothetical protein